MRLGLCTVLYAQNGDVMLDASENSELTFLSRRLSRTATLDGGCEIVDNGYTPSDGVIKIVVEPTQNSPALYAQIMAIIQQFGLVTIASEQGVFLAAIESVTNPKSLLTINLLIHSQVSV